MSIQELEAEALKLSEVDRLRLAERLRVSVETVEIPQDDPFWELGTDPVDGGPADGAEQHKSEW
ncbi:MAG TPA: hypothetical protein VNP72_01865 [Longimicrobium sp.]|nr:hypothetical protein [Longimicrobium sp.]